MTISNEKILGFLEDKVYADLERLAMKLGNDLLSRNKDRENLDYTYLRLREIIAYIQNFFVTVQESKNEN